jgi:ABC-2 type transport system ATP-binding protein
MDARLPLYCKNLTVKRRTHCFLSDIIFKIHPGEIVGLIGLNGAGKSTLLKAIVGLIPSVTGDCYLFGEDFKHPSARRFLSYLPEKVSLSPALRGTDFLKIMLPTVPKKRIDSLCQLLDFESQWLGNKVGTYSKGTLQKLGLLSFFAKETPLSIGDEIMSGLDMKTRPSVGAYLKQQRAAGNSFLLSTHSWRDAEELCDRLLWLEDKTIKTNEQMSIFLS